VDNRQIGVSAPGSIGNVDVVRRFESHGLLAATGLRKNTDRILLGPYTGLIVAAGDWWCYDVYRGQCVHTKVGLSEGSVSGVSEQ